MIDPADIKLIVDQVFENQKRVAWRYACGSVLVSVLLTWLLLRAEIERNSCSCESVHAVANGNIVTVLPPEDPATTLGREKLIQQGFLKRGGDQ